MAEKLDRERLDTSWDDDQGDVDAEAIAAPDAEAIAAPGADDKREVAADAGPGADAAAVIAPAPNAGRDAGREAEIGPGFAPEVEPAVAPEVEPEVEPELPGRPTALRLARLHLRTGSLALARAELEALAGRGALDEDALVDLAEVRWRTGDLSGAGGAANAALSHGRTDVLALVIAAEAMAGLGRPGEARRLAGRALDAVAGPLDPIFAGMPRAAVWPGEAVPGPDETAPTALTPAVAAVAGGAAGAAGAVSAGAAEAFAGGRAALAGADATTAAVRLGVAIRLDPGFARGVLDAVGERPDQPILALVAGDALRLLGREAEALAAFDLARGKPVVAPVVAPEPSVAAHDPG